MESWPWFHIMDEAMHGRLYNSSLVLGPEAAAHHPPRCCGGGLRSDHQENTDILEFLIKTEMDDTAAQEAADDGGAVHTNAPPTEGVPMGWRRMSECSYKSRCLPRVQLLLASCFSSSHPPPHLPPYLSPLFLLLSD